MWNFLYISVVIISPFHIFPYRLQRLQPPYGPREIAPSNRHLSSVLTPLHYRWRLQYTPSSSRSRTHTPQYGLCSLQSLLPQSVGLSVLFNEHPRLTYMHPKRSQAPQKRDQFHLCQRCRTPLYSLMAEQPPSLRLRPHCHKYQNLATHTKRCAILAQLGSYTMARTLPSD